MRRSLVPLLASALAVVAAVAWGIGREHPRGERVGRSVDAAARTASGAVVHDPVLVDVHEPEEEVTVGSSSTESRTRSGFEREVRRVEQPSGGASMQHVTGRAVGIDGAPLVRTRLRLAVELPMPSATLLRTDQEGHFAWVPPPNARGRASLRVLVRERVASFEIPAHAGERDLGDVQFDLPPVVVTGRLFDEHGPIAGLPLFAHPVGSVPDRDSRVRGSTDHDGAFTLRSNSDRLPDPDRRHELHVESTRHAAARWTFEPGADLGDLRLARHGVVRGRLVLDPSWPREELSVGAWESRHWTRLERDGSFELWVPPGSHRLVLGGIAWVGDVWFLTDDVDVRVVGETVLAGLDLRSEFDVTRIRVIRPDGTPLTSATFRRPGLVRRTAVGHEFVFLHRRAGDSVVTDVQGFAREHVECTGRSHEVRLRSAPQIRLQIEGERRLGLLQVAIQPLGSDECTWLELPNFDLERRFQVDTPGVWHVWAARGRTAAHRRVELGTIHVRDVAGVQAFVLAAPDDL